MKTLSSTVTDAAATLVARLPRRLALAGGRRLGDLTALAVRGRRRVVQANLALALPGVDAAARQRIARLVFRHFGENVVETLMLPEMVRRGLDRYVTHEGWSHLEEAVSRGRGAIVFTGHFGNWELVALAQGARGIPMDVVGRPLDNAALGRRLEATRKLTGNSIISKRAALRPMLASLRAGRTVGLVVDQNDASASAVFVDFFGVKAATTPALAVLALRTGAPVVPVFGFPERGRHRIVYGPAVTPPSSGNLAQDVQAMTAAVTAVIEDQVRRRPELWLWMHDRWRSRPPEDAPATTASAPEKVALETTGRTGP